MTVMTLMLGEVKGRKDNTFLITQNVKINQ